MGLYKRFTPRTSRTSRRPQSKPTSQPLPRSAHLALAISLFVAILSLLTAPTLLPYLRHRFLTTTTTTARASTLHSNNSYNFATTFCNVPRIHTAHLTRAAFIGDYAGKRPVILLNDQHNAHFRQYVTKDSILSEYGHFPVILSASNSYTKHKKTVTVEEYGKFKPRS